MWKAVSTDTGHAIHDVNVAQHEVVNSRAFKDYIDVMHVVSTVAAVAAPILAVIPVVGEVAAPIALLVAATSSVTVLEGDALEMADGAKKPSGWTLAEDGISVVANVTDTGVVGDAIHAALPDVSDASVVLAGNALDLTGKVGDFVTGGHQVVVDLAHHDYVDAIGGGVGVLAGVAGGSSPDGQAISSEIGGFSNAVSAVDSYNTGGLQAAINNVTGD
ncbi:hypothetical protein K6U06_14625 [Acidiferrimicrobium sp. IK]|uniref:hypothetical protein n=1 Tax=Acidiferrimicrobium sp. IK TaxID=2871700 RepID=UPI0021CAEC60|nr:hypothetical protein [Acidiferrimicrobium sp. IK]MCU4185600.1 hypothetical protein [Acidiferrimicrobium sp. IK]